MNVKKGMKCLARALMILSFISLLVLSIPRFAGLKCYIVLSGSMRPALPVGSAVYVSQREPQKIQKGEIITYTTEKVGAKVTHRVYETDEKNRCFLTKGDANASVDAKPVSWEHVCGVVTFVVPYMGYILKFLDTWTGKMVVVSWLVLLYLWAECMESIEEKEQEGVGI